MSAMKTRGLNQVWRGCRDMVLWTWLVDWGRKKKPVQREGEWKIEKEWKKKKKGSKISENGKWELPGL